MCRRRCSGRGDVRTRLILWRSKTAKIPKDSEIVIWQQPHGRNRSRQPGKQALAGRWPDAKGRVRYRTMSHCGRHRGKPSAQIGGTSGDANLNETDLFGTRLYEADLACQVSSWQILMRWISSVRTCTTLILGDLEKTFVHAPRGPAWGRPLGSPDFSYANIKNATPQELINWIKDSKNGFKAVELEDSDWQSWRKNGFRMDSAGTPVLDPKLNKDTDSYPCERITPAPPKH